MLNKISIKTFLRDLSLLFYPKCCIFCDDALHRMNFENTCDHCFEEVEFFELNEKATAVFKYTPITRYAIHRFKYSDRPYYSKYFGKIMCDYLELKDMSMYDLIIPIPMHKSKLRKRGFNQAALLAQEISNRFSIPLNTKSLVRIKSTKAQSKVSFDDRSKNLQQAFGVIEKHNISEKNILLIDDIYTSGNTINYCRDVLMENGAKNVDYFVLSRA